MKRILGSMCMMACLLVVTMGYDDGIDRDKVTELSMSRGKNPTHVCWDDDCYPDRVAPLPAKSSKCKCKKDCPTIIINNNCASNNATPSPAFSCPSGSTLFQNSTSGACTLTVSPPPTSLGQMRAGTLTGLLVTSSQPSSTAINCDGVIPTMIASASSIPQFSVPPGVFANSVSSLFMSCDDLTITTSGNGVGCSLMACIAL